eukprot:CAMPEP_0182532132 /NCGR_PEP_ID=MMETSP1323-20130603/10972_1 /TAXON_ID=236787 /ORGANISM="Florenciella parvula, Strain RCC1693" /LENGTH=141 /DNA_ID=CAMNT_0024741823 /DNA_START=293 /DNA_END=718 /DNA_ORIENTATION=+
MAEKGRSDAAANESANVTHRDGSVRFLDDGTACIVEYESVGPIFCAAAPAPPPADIVACCGGPVTDRHQSQHAVAEYGAAPSFFCCPAACGPRVLFCDDPYDEGADYGDGEERPLLLRRDPACTRERKMYRSISEADAMHR